MLGDQERSYQAQGHDMGRLWTVEAEGRARALVKAKKEENHRKIIFCRNSLLFQKHRMCREGSIMK